jgi:hypothetical protein
MMRSAILASLAASACTVGAAGRAELSYDFDGAPDVRASVQGGTGITYAPTGLAWRETVTFLLFSVGGGWGTDGPFLTFAGEIVTVPPPGAGSTGLVLALRQRIDPRRCMHVSFEVGGARIITQSHDERDIGPWGADEKLTRWYHDANVFVGLDECPGGERVHVGGAYDVGMAKLFFTPGP